MAGDGQHNDTAILMAENLAENARPLAGYRDTDCGLGVEGHRAQAPGRGGRGEGTATGVEDGDSEGDRQVELRPRFKAMTVIVPGDAS